MRSRQQYPREGKGYRRLPGSGIPLAVCLRDPPEKTPILKAQDDHCPAVRAWRSERNDIDPGLCSQPDRGSLRSLTPPFPFQGESTPEWHLLPDGRRAASAAMPRRVLHLRESASIAHETMEPSPCGRKQKSVESRRPCRFVDPPCQRLDLPGRRPLWAPLRAELPRAVARPGSTPR